MDEGDIDAPTGYLVVWWAYGDTNPLWNDTSCFHWYVAPFSFLPIYPLGSSRVLISPVQGWTFLSGFATVG